MSQTIGEREYFTTEELEDNLKRNVPDVVQAQKIRLAHQRDVFTARRREVLDKNPGLGVTGSPLSAAASFGNMVGLRLPNWLASAVTAPFTANSRDIGLGDAFDLNRARGNLILEARPVAHAVGTVGAFFTPGSAAKAVVHGGFKVAGGAKLAKLASESTNIWKTAALQLSSAAAGGAGAITAINVAEGVLDERDASEVLGDIFRQVKSPTNIALTLAIGGGATAIRAVPDQAAVRLVESAKRLLPGFKATPDMLRPEGGFLAGLVDSLSVSPAGRRAVAKYLSTSVYQPLRKAVDELRQAITPAGRRTKDLTPSAAKDIRDLLITPKGRKGDGIIRNRIAHAGDKGFREAARSGDVVSRGEAASLLRVFRSLETRARRAKGTEGPHGSEYTGVIKSLRGVIKDAGKVMRAGGEWNLTPQMLDNIRQRLAPVASFDARRGGAVQIGARDIRDAKDMYAAIREVQRSSSSSIDNALTDIHQLRKVLDTFKPLEGAAPAGNDINLVRTMFTAKDFSARWESATSVLKKEQLQRIRGAYFAEFLEEITLMRSITSKNEFLLNARKMNEMFRRPGQFRGQVFDTVLPGVREDVTRLAEISDLVMRTIGKAEGSATARRTADMAVVAGAADTAKLAVSAMKDPHLGWYLFGRLLTIPGVLAFTESLLTGRVAGALNRAASGGVIAPGGTLPAVVQQQEGLTETTDRALGTAGKGVAALGSLL